MLLELLPFQCSLARPLSRGSAVQGAVLATNNQQSSLSMYGDQEEMQKEKVSLQAFLLICQLCWDQTGHARARVAEVSASRRKGSQESSDLALPFQLHK